MRCIAHSLSPCLKTPFAKCHLLKAAVEKLASIISRVHHSTQLTEIAKKEIKLAFRTRNATCWNSIYLMCERALRFDWMNSSLPSNMRLSGAYVDILRELVDFMKPFQESFKLLQRAQFPTISSVLPIIFALRKRVAVSCSMCCTVLYRLNSCHHKFHFL